MLCMRVLHFSSTHLGPGDANCLVSGRAATKPAPGDAGRRAQRRARRVGLIAAASQRETNHY